MGLSQTLLSTKGDHHYPSVAPEYFHLNHTKDFVPIGMNYRLNILRNVIELHQTRFILGPKRIDTTQCIEVLTTGILASVQCNLPPHCGNVLYEKQSSNWFRTEVGVCIGMGFKPMSYRFEGKAFIPPQWRMITHMMITGNVTQKTDITMVVLWDPINHYTVVPKYTINEYPILDLRTFDFVMPIMREIQGKKCVDYTHYTDCPLELVNVDPWLYAVFQPTNHHNHNVDALQDTLFEQQTCWLRSTLQVSRSKYQNIRCEATRATSNMLPTVISSIPKTIGNVVLVVLRVIAETITNSVYELLHILSYVIDLPTFCLGFIYLVYKHRAVVDSAIISFIISLIIAHIRK
jgi:hypothetical protein